MSKVRSPDSAVGKSASLVSYDSGFESRCMQEFSFCNYFFVWLVPQSANINEINLVYNLFKANMNSYIHLQTAAIFFYRAFI